MKRIQRQTVLVHLETVHAGKFLERDGERTHVNRPSETINNPLNDPGKKEKRRTRRKKKENLNSGRINTKTKTRNL